ncbi:MULTISPECIES: type II secretion system inner membrane protein GspF [unclassified Motilimonas]|uniref:type II secretion system inner membrane protein GspF n=1 Tax=Motilimonas TaxID=1914248 RepID=UPI001E4E9817|nr:MULTISPECIES: type II secretion system inner membrane protein GspF [unclassified Motilimonas]MCE0557367.1 type II secretion system inner membrane protein GspF [Motilimonas sp. E26]MDO6527355.1 type II secretion system inner membrane protein GspF [Motilimonas sp. 1_MG-2023]
MATFEYKALDKKGKQKKGLQEADTARQVRQILRDRGLTPIEVMAAAEQAKKESKGGFSFKRKISTPELALMTRQLSTLVASSMPIEECLKAVVEQTDKPKVKSMLSAVRSRVLEGYTLAGSMAEFPHIFDDLFCAMVAAGEKAGHLELVLDRLADYTEQRQQMRSKLMQAMIYPLMLTLVAIGVVSILLTSVVPQVVGQFEHMGQDLPGSTLFLIASSDFLRDYGLFIVSGIALGLFGLKQYLKNPKNQLKFDRVLLQVPVVGKVSRDLNTARFARTLSILNASAVPLLEGMKIAGEVLSNLYARGKVGEATEFVREGSSLGAALENTKLFPPMMLHMIASGERSGELDQMLERSADNQDKQFAAQVNMALGVFEPALVVSMAGVVLFIVAAILQPMLALNNMVGG